MSEHKKPKHPNGIVTSDAVAAEARPSVHKVTVSKKSKLWVGLAVVVVLAAGLWLVFGRHEKVAAPQSVGQSLLQGELKTAQDAVDRANETGSVTQKAKAYSDLGAAYVNVGETGKAVQAYKDAQGLSSNLSAVKKRQMLTGLGYAYAYDGENDKAIESLQAAMKLLQTEATPDRDMQIQSLQNDINRLKEGKSL
jgi:tetratricopeptide (TPR) repeat protein